MFVWGYSKEGIPSINRWLQLQIRAEISSRAEIQTDYNDSLIVRKHPKKFSHDGRT